MERPAKGRGLWLGLAAIDPVSRGGENNGRVHSNAHVQLVPDLCVCKSSSDTESNCGGHSYFNCTIILIGYIAKTEHVGLKDYANPIQRTSVSHTFPGTEQLCIYLTMKWTYIK